MSDTENINMSDSNNTASKTVDFSLAHTTYVDKDENLKEFIEEAHTVLTQSQLSVEVIHHCARDLQKSLDLYDDSWVTYHISVSSVSGLLNAKMQAHTAD